MRKIKIHAEKLFFPKKLKPLPIIELKNQKEKLWMNVYYIFGISEKSLIIHRSSSYKFIK